MPLYEYKCENCGTKFELRRSIGAGDEPASCPTCESRDSKRQLSLFIALTKGAEGGQNVGGGCGCGGSCACGSSHLN